jgi:hypothetical protein
MSKMQNSQSISQHMPDATEAVRWPEPARGPASTWSLDELLTIDRCAQAAAGWSNACRAAGDVVPAGVPRPSDQRTEKPSSETKWQKHTAARKRKWHVAR